MLLLLCGFMLILILFVRFITVFLFIQLILVNLNDWKL